MKLKIIFIIILILLLFSCLLAEIEELFFSEYIEGSSYNKALEIYNGTGVTVDLTNYQLWQVANGGNWYEYIIDFPPGAYIADGDVYVVCHEEADAIILAVADLVVTLYHNGNDAQGLAKDDGTGTFYLIDTIGEEGADPGDGWAVAGINNATKDHTLVRKSTVEAPTTDWALSAGTNPSDSQWEVYAINTFDYIGFHDTGADIIPPTLISAIALSSSSVEITFSEVVTPGTAENSENYFISELPITSAVLQGNGITVTLTTSEQNPGQSYTIVVNNIEDLAENVIATDSEISFSGYQIIEMELFFSEYIEGSSNNKALEIYNGTGAAVNLAGYEIWRISNGGDWAEGESNAVSLEGILENNDVYVICNSNANAEIQAVSDLIGTTATYYNGNDAVGLAHNGILIDAIGEEGPDVGIAWDVAGTTEATLNHTLVRKPDILQGNMNWALSAGTNTENSEWFVYNEDTFDYLGYHLVSGEDTYPPIMTSAFATSITSVEISFNEALDETTSEDITNYSIDPFLDLSSASLGTNKVTLTTSEQTEGENYTITVNNVEDLAGNPIEAGSTINFTGYGGTQYNLIADIQADPSSYEGQTVTICGIVTIGVNVIQTGNTNAYVQDNSERGINIYDSSVINELERGNLVEITGQVTQYYDTTEIIDPIVTLLSTGNPEPEPLDFYLGDASDFELEGTLLRVRGEIIDVWSAGDGTNIEIKDDENNEITVRVWDTTGLNLSEYVEGFNLQAVGIGDVFNEMQIVPGYQDQLSEAQDIEDTYPPIMTSAFATSITSVEITFNEALDETTSEDITNYSVTPYLNISSASLSTNNVTLTTDEQVEEQIYTITVNNVEDLVGNPITPGSTIDFTGYSPSEYDLIADIQADPSSYEGQTVTICGIVTIGVNVIQTGNTNAYVQDNSERGINIYDSSVIDDLERGNLVEITGQVTQYFDTTEIIDPIVTVLSTGNPEPEPLDFYLGDASDFELEGTLLRVKGEIIDVWPAGGGTNIVIEDDEDNEITVRVWDTTGLNLSEYVEGFNLQAVGIGDVFSEMQIVPGYQDQLSEAQDIEENVTTDPENPLAGEEVTVTYTSPDPLENALLFWKTSGDLEYEYIEMDSVGQRDISYQCVIPGQSQGTVVYYYLVITDTTGESYSIPENAPDDDVMSYSYKVTSLKAILNIPAKPFDPYAGEKFPIEFATETGNKAILRIYNAEGKLVLTPKNIIVPHPGISTYEWDGRDKNHKLLPLGLYICYLEVVDTDTGKKKSAKAPIVIGAPLK